MDRHDETCAAIADEDAVDTVSCKDDGSKSDDGAKELRVLTP